MSLSVLTILLKHFFEFAIMPHKGHFMESQVVNVSRGTLFVKLTLFLFALLKHSSAYNSPMHLLHTKEPSRNAHGPELRIQSELSPNLILDTIKRGLSWRFLCQNNEATDFPCLTDRRR